MHITMRVSPGALDKTYDVILESPEHDIVFYAADWAEAEAIGEALKSLKSVGVYRRRVDDDD